MPSRLFPSHSPFNFLAMDSLSNSCKIIVGKSGFLRPILAQHTGRYDVSKKVQRSHALIGAGMFHSSRDPLPTYLPPQWSESVHPEGNIYFHRDTGLRVVTDAHLYTPEVAQRICDWAASIESQAAKAGFVFDDQVELFLQLEDEDCNYYFANFATHALFWLEEHETSELGLLPVVSSSHLKLLLEAQFWTHVESFPTHFGGLPQKVIDDLILVFYHALADNLTSSTSTFSYDTPHCEKFLKLLRESRDRIHDGHVVTVVARLWSIIIYGRYETHFGQAQARLCRDTSILIDQEQELQWSRNILSLITLKISEAYLTHLDKLYIDRLVYGNDWNDFMTQCIKGWQKTSIASVLLLLLHIFCFFLPVTYILVYTSATLATLGLITAVLMIVRHEDLQNAGAAPAQEYLRSVCSTRFKFQGVALGYSLPRALVYWSFLTFLANWTITLYQHLPTSSALVLLISALAITLTCYCATSRAPWGIKDFHPVILCSNKVKDEASVV